MRPVHLFGALTGATLALTACAVPAKKVEIRTEPPGAEILSLDGSKIGEAPLVLSGEALARVTRDNKALVLVDSAGYIPRQLAFDIHGEDTVTLSLTRLDPEFFSRRMLKDYQKDINALARELLRIQGLIMVRNLNEAERALEEFQKKYPNVAAGYALLGNIEMVRGNPIKAQAWLTRGEALDPDDPAIKRALGMKVRETAPAAAAKNPRKVANPKKP